MKNDYPDLLNTYYQNSIDWELAETISLRTDTHNLTVTMEGELKADRNFSIKRISEEEFEEGERSYQLEE